MIEDIQDYDNLALRAMFEKEGMVQIGYVITPDDYEATKTRAQVLAEGIKGRVSVETLLLTAFADRMRTLSKIGDEAIKALPDEVLRNLLSIDTGYTPTDDELKLLRGSPLGLKEWEKERLEVKGKIQDFDVAVDDKDDVIAAGASPRKAVRRAQDDVGR